MKSIKPGRGPSMMGGIGAFAAAFFGVIWSISAASMGAPWFFSLFGVVFIIMGVAQGVYHLKNASGKNRFSSFDITDEYEEPDPLNRRFGDDQPDYRRRDPDHAASTAFCPYCGAPVAGDHIYCKKCGKRM